MPNTRCKVACTATGQTKSHYQKDGEILHTAEFAAVYGNSEENQKFFKFTPSLTLKTGTINQRFEVGKEYYLDFTEVEA